MLGDVAEKDIDVVITHTFITCGKSRCVLGFIMFHIKEEWIILFFGNTLTVQYCDFFKKSKGF